jgi:hypothetical protein
MRVQRGNNSGDPEESWTRSESPRSARKSPAGIRIASRIYEAIAAIGQRLVSPLESGSAKQKALQAAHTSIVRLKAKKLRTGGLSIGRVISA